MGTAAGRTRLQDFEQHPFDFSNALVVLDVDGTLVPDCGRRASGAVIRKVIELKQRGNEIRLCSNSRRGDYAERLTALASQLDVGVCPVAFRKPSMLVLSGLDWRYRRLIVIGDKDLTDGLLARRAGADFIKVRRKIDPADRLSSRLANLFDNMFGALALYLWDLFATTHYNSSNSAVDR
jgi:predicted HAD superfamily phosphohydrolase YqeG